MATLKEIADIAHVNVSTVSKALRGSTDLSEQTIASIRRIAEELHYPVQHNKERDARKKDSDLVGVVAPEIISPYYATMLDSLCRHLKQNGLRMQLMLSDFSPEEELRCARELVRTGVCALACFSETSEISPSLRKLICDQTKIPFLLVSMTEDSGVCDNVCMDDWQSALIAINHLISLGHRRIAYVGDMLSHPRRRAYETALHAADIPVRPEYIVEVDARFEECGRLGMEQLLELKERPTAVFAAYDNVAIGLLSVAQRAGLRVPEDLSLISIDDIGAAAYLNPPLTTVTEFTRDVGELVTDMLIGKLRNKRQYVQNVKLCPTLNLRGSTAPCNE